MKSFTIELMPPEEMEKVLDSTLEAFIKGPISKRFKIEKSYDKPDTIVPILTYDPTEDPTTLPGMILIEMRKKAKATIEAVLESEEYSGKWNPKTCGKEIVDGVMKDIVKDNINDFVLGLFQQIMVGATNHTLQYMRNNSRGY